MDTRTLKIARPCPVELDVDRNARQFFCDHCQKDVHVLGNWPRAEAEAFIAANRGNSMCVSLRRDSQGELVYADSPARQRPPELVPAARLRRRWLPEAAAAAGVAAALTACTPHQPFHSPERPAVEDEPPCTVPSVTVPDEDPPQRAEEDREVGKLVIPKPRVEPRIERGEPPIIEKPAPKSPKQPVKPEKPAKPERPDWDAIDGGIDF
jgi:hypothetical protein